MSRFEETFILLGGVVAVGVEIYVIWILFKHFIL